MSDLKDNYFKEFFFLYTLGIVFTIGAVYILNKFKSQTNDTLIWYVYIFMILFLIIISLFLLKTNNAFIAIIGTIIIVGYGIYKISTFININNESVDQTIDQTIDQTTGNQTTEGNETFITTGIIIAFVVISIIAIIVIYTRSPDKFETGYNNLKSGYDKLKGFFKRNVSEEEQILEYETKIRENERLADLKIRLAEAQKRHSNAEKILECVKKNYIVKTPDIDTENCTIKYTGINQIDTSFTL